jgi:hypothetical protein
MDESYQYNIQTQKKGYFACSANVANNDNVSEKTLFSISDKNVNLYLTSERNQQAIVSKTGVDTVAPEPENKSTQITEPKKVTNTTAASRNYKDDVFQKGYYSVISPQLNLREGEGTTFKVIKLLNKGEKVLVLSVTKGWAKIMMLDNQTSGYVLFNYLAKIDEGSKLQGNTTTKKKKSTDWGNIIFVVIIFILIILYVFGKVSGSSSGGSKGSKTFKEKIVDVKKDKPLPEIGNIEEKNGDFIIFDKSGKRMYSLTVSGRILWAYSSKIIVCEFDGEWIIYDAKFQKIRGVFKHNEKVIRVEGETIFVQEGDQIVRRDKTWKKF